MRPYIDSLPEEHSSEERNDVVTQVNQSAASSCSLSTIPFSREDKGSRAQQSLELRVPKDRWNIHDAVTTVEEFEPPLINTNIDFTQAEISAVTSDSAKAIIQGEKRKAEERKFLGDIDVCPGLYSSEEEAEPVKLTKKQKKDLKARQGRKAEENRQDKENSARVKAAPSKPNGARCIAYAPSTTSSKTGTTNQTGTQRFVTV